MPLLKSSSSFSMWEIIVSRIWILLISFSEISPTTSPLRITSPLVKVTEPAIGSISEIRYPLYCSMLLDNSYKLSSTLRILISRLMDLSYFTSNSMRALGGCLGDTIILSRYRYLSVPRKFLTWKPFTSILLTNLWLYASTASNAYTKLWCSLWVAE